PDPKTTNKVKEWPRPTTSTEVHAFIGLCSYHRHFISNFAQKAASLHHLTQKNVPFVWSTEHEDAFWYFKQDLTNPPIMAFPNFHQPFKLYTDASITATGAVLAQEQQGTEKILSLHSLCLTKIPVENDATGRHTRWTLELDLFQWHIQYHHGKRHGNADSMSRRPPDAPSTTTYTSVSTTNECPVTSIETPGLASVNLTDIFSADGNELIQQQSDPILCKVIVWKQQKKHPAYWAIEDEPLALKVHPWLVATQGILYMRGKKKPGKSSTLLAIIPDAMRQQVMEYLHGHPMVGHLGINKTLQRAWDVCYWPGMSKDLSKFCKQCLPCQSRSMPNPRVRAPMQSVLATYPFQKVAADITELPITTRCNRYVLFVQDYFSKYVNLYAFQDQCVATIAQCLFEKYLQEHGFPESLHTDQGRQFESDMVQQICHLLRIIKTRTSAYHPQGDGMVERYNWTLKDQLAKTLYEKGSQWDEHLSQMQLAYNTSVHDSTGYTPFFLVHEREARLPIHWM
uniref:Gypsy retrotransposon integrase-like protein 1 n=1 Tax=Latimeria chalumnae TaxID=7897 RepID=H3BCP7_LATCH